MPLLAVSADGSVLVTIVEGGAMLFRADSEWMRELMAPHAEQVLAFADQVWLLARDGADVVVTRFTGEGAAFEPPLRLPDVGALSAESLVARACSSGATHGVVLGPRGAFALRDDLGRLVAHAIAGPPLCVVPLAPHVRVDGFPDHVVVREQDSEREIVLPPGAVLRGGEALPDGRSVLLDLGDYFAVLDLRTNAITRQVGLEAHSTVLAVARRGHLLVHRGGDTIGVFDLRFRRTLKEVVIGSTILEVATDIAGDQILLLVHAPDAPAEVLCTSYAALFGKEQGQRPSARVRQRAPLRPASASTTTTPTPSSNETSDERQTTIPAEPTPLARDELATFVPHQLVPRSPQPQPPDVEITAHLRDGLDRVAAWCRVAIATGWDSGRISTPATSGLPFVAEVNAILDRAGGNALDELSTALRRLGEIDQRYLSRWRGAADTRTAPLERLALEFGLSPLATDLLLVVAAPVLWGELTRIFAIVANDPARPVCDELLLGQLLGSDPRLRRDIARELDDDAPLMRHGLLRVRAGRRPFRALEVPEVVIKRICGERFADASGSNEIELRLADRALVELRVPPDEVRRVVAALSTPLANNEHARLVVRGRTGSGRRTLLAALAAAANRPLGLVEVPLALDGRVPIGDLLRERLADVALRGWIPCVSGIELLLAAEPTVREQARLAFAAHPGPLALRCGLDVTPPLAPGYLAIDLPPLSENERTAAWEESLRRAALPIESAGILAAKYRIGPGTIERILRQAPGDPDNASVLFAVDAQVKQFRHGKIGDVATRITRLPTWSSTVLPTDLLDSLREFIGRVQRRRKVFEDWGFDRVMASSRGLTAMFQGGPGTGKSMVAGVIARELGFELYRIDLGRILSKWIGETEKNLAAVFDAAEDGDVVLLFDEADSLFAKRTEIKSSVDRYANVEVNYLLQRLDTFEGIAILTTNFGTSIDPAFKRRLSLRLNFPFPDEEQRAQIWRVHLPPSLPLDGTIDLQLLAQKYQLSGGYIRNAALRAAFLAAQENTGVSQEHLERAIKLEYREVGMLTDSGVLE